MWRDQQPAAAQRVVASVGDVVEDCVRHVCDGVCPVVTEKKEEKKQREMKDSTDLVEG